MTRTIRLAVVAFLLIGCGDAVSFEADVCGNRVLDRGEDCDTFGELGADTVCAPDNEVNACHYTCGGDAVCPKGWGCGRDLRCRRPAGGMSTTPNSGWPLPSLLLNAGDVDGDGFGDVIGSQAGSITVRFGDSSGQLPASTSLTLRLSGRPSFADMNQDDRLDIVAPVIGGIGTGLMTLLGQDARRLLPVPYSTDAGRVSVLFPFDVGTGSGIATVQDSTISYLVNEIAGTASLPAGKIGSDIQIRIPLADVDRPISEPSQDQSWVFAFVDDPTLYLYKYDVPQVVERQQIEVPGALNIQSVLFADVSGDDFHDLIISYDSAQGPKTKFAAYEPGTQMFVLDKENDPLEHLVLAAGNLAQGTATADFVLSQAIITSNGFVSSVFQTWTEAEIGDFNGDGNLDVAVTIDGAALLDVYLGDGNGAFNQFSIPTLAIPTRLRSGDFDGDFFSDLAFLMPSPFGLGDELFISYGGVAGPSAPTIMARPGVVRDLRAFRLKGGLLAGGDATDDLIVLASQTPETTDRYLLFLQGNAERYVFSPFGLGDLENSAIATIPGEFAKPELGEANRQDVCAIEHNNDASFRYALLPNRGGEGNLDSPPIRSLVVPSAEFLAFCAIHSVVDLDGDGIDEIVSLENAFICDQNVNTGALPDRIAIASFDESLVASVDIQRLPDNIGLRLPSRLLSRDVDGDGDFDIVIGFVGSDSGSSGALILWNEGGTLDIGNPTEIAISGSTVHDLATISLGVDVQPAIALLTDDGVSIVNINPETQQASDPSPLLVKPDQVLLVVEDINADGIDDIVLSNNRLAEVYLGTVAPALGDVLSGEMN